MSFSNWNPYDKYVQSGMVDGAYATGAYTMVAAGPPRLATLGADVSASQASAIAGGLFAPGGASVPGKEVVYPIGVTQNFNVSHNRQFSRIFELGSERSYFISGRTVGQIGIGRVYYHGASLLRVLYAYYQDTKGGVKVQPMFQNSYAQMMANPHDVAIPPGYENVFINLASDLFAQPIGLMLYMKDLNLGVLGAAYFEACYVPSHSWGTDSQGVVIQEQAGIQFERCVPVNVSGLTLITGANSGGANTSTRNLGVGGTQAGI